VKRPGVDGNFTEVTMKKIVQTVVVALVFIFSTHAQAADGLVTVKSPHSSKDTMDRLETVAKQKGMTIFARIDHSAGAAKVGMKLRSTELLIFGNPQGGTPFMECNQTLGIDLPLKALVWEDASGQVWLGTTILNSWQKAITYRSARLWKTYGRRLLGLLKQPSQSDGGQF
jgi:uncharacterized protein (DUF302 family)